MQYENLLAGAYHVEKTLDRSTYSVLCVGRQVNTGKSVRLRLWLTAHATSLEEQQRIQTEVAAIQAAQHQHLLPILEVRTTGQGVFIASAATQDGSLNTRLNRHFLKPLPLAEALIIVDQVGQALQSLHEHGITHGNLTPLAIFLSEPNHVQLGEFHLSSIQQSIQGYQPLLDENIPRCWYMAPEQFSGHLDAQTDQYALGCLAYALLTGRVPFAGSSRATLLQKHQHEQPRSLIALNAAVPVLVETAVLKALAKSPAERHRSVRAFLQALVDVASVPVMVPPEEIVNVPLTAQPEEAAHTSIAAASGVVPSIDVHPVVSPAASASTSEPEARNVQDAFANLATLKQPALGPSKTVRARPILRTRQTVLGPLSEQASRARGLTVLAPMITLVLVIVLVLGSWFLLTGGRALPGIVGGATPSSTQGVSATSTSSLQPTTAETVNAIGVHYATPTVTSTTTPISTTTPTVSPTAVPTATPTAAPTATPTTPPVTITPLLDCIVPVNASFAAVFGYTNNGNATVTIPKGPNNALFLMNGSQVQQAQPTSFAPGTHKPAFQVRFPRNSSVTWRLNGVEVTATPSTPEC
ncbi:MAG: serine/threonine protein kinase [Ktedonobacteraceae bacterium]